MAESKNNTMQYTTEMPPIIEFDPLDDGALSDAVLKSNTLLAVAPVAVYLIVLTLLSIISVLFLVLVFPSSSGITMSAYVAVCLLFLTLFSVFLRPLIPVRDPRVAIALDPEGGLTMQLGSVVALLTQGRLKQVTVSPDLVVDLWFDDLDDYKKQLYTLTIGAALLSELSEQELFALVAKEAARFKMPKQATYYAKVRFLLAWMHSISNGYDGFTEKLKAKLRKNVIMKIVTAPYFYLNRWVASVFSGLYRFTESVSKTPLEKMDFYSDRYLAQVVGSKNIDALFQHLVQIDQSYQASLKKVVSGEPVPNDFFEAVAKDCRAVAATPGQHIEMAQSERFNSWYFLSLPNARIREARSFSLEAKLDGDNPALELVENFSEISVAVTEELYAELGIEVTGDSAVEANEKTVTFSIDMSSQEKLLRRVTSGLFRSDMVWEFPKADKFDRVSEENLTPFLNKLVISIRHNLPVLTQYMSFADEYAKYEQRSHYGKWLAKDGSKTRVPIEELEKIAAFKKDFDKKFDGKKVFYRKSYGVRVAAAVTLGRESKAYKSALKLIQMLARLGHIQDTISDVRVKCATLEKLIICRTEGDGAHSNTISRFTRMTLKAIGNFEEIMSALPTSLLPGELDPMTNKLELDRLNGADYERLVAERFRELDVYYQAFNVAMSAKLGQFVEMVERTKGIESVTVAHVSEHKP